MGILKKAVNEQAFLKAGIFGNAGSGKTTTASYLAMAISAQYGNKKPVAFFETEAGSDFMLERFNAEGIELLRVKSHSLADLIDAAREAEAVCSALIVDSITHIWNDAMDSKLRMVNKARAAKGLRAIDKLEFQHYGDIKRNWAGWTTLFLNSRLHILVCGRAGNIWEYELNEETGKKELQKGGTKMKAEGEFGYEPSLLIEMERVPKGGDSGGWKHRATVLKDRTDHINGLAFDFEKPRKVYKAGDWKQTYKPFEPIFKSLNLGGEHVTIDPSRTAETLFPGPEGESRGVERAKLVDITLEEIHGTLDVLWPGRTDAMAAARLAAIETIFHTRSKKAVEAMRLEDLQAGLKALRLFEAKVKAEPEAQRDLVELLTLCITESVGAGEVQQ